MNWEEMTPEQRDRLVHEKVMECDEFTMIGKLGKKVFITLSEDDIENEVEPIQKIPRYTQSMDAAWLVVRMMNNSDSPTFHSYQGYADFIDALEKIVGSNMFFDLFYCDQYSDHLTPERICQAALQAKGVDVK